MRRGNFRAHWNCEFKQGQLAVGVFAFEQEADFNLPGSDDCVMVCQLGRE